MPGRIEVSPGPPPPERGQPESASESEPEEEYDDDDDEPRYSHSQQQQQQQQQVAVHQRNSALYHLQHEADHDEDVRHGFAEAYSSEEYLQALEKSYFLYWTEPRHEYAGLPKPPSLNPADHKIDWRNRDRIRTAAAVLVICLRIGYDPPDIIKTDPCAKLECWVDPYSLPKDKAMDRIGKNLQHQFEALAATPKTRYKYFLDPPIEDAKRFCPQARRTAKNERVLFYYNGHGVPKPTTSGELWLFNKAYTQYIPVSLADIVNWLGSPTTMVWDCSAAGNIVTKVEEFGIKRDAEIAREAANPSSPMPPGVPNGLPGADVPQEKLQVPTVPFRETIQLAACLGHETLPMNPDLPADLFTCCLTSPIEIALRFFLLRHPLKTGLTLEMLLELPGKLNDRRTPLGELTWIFTAVTDTIAWNTLPRELFQKLFRHDLVVAALFRGFLLAERIMRFYECTPISVPALPHTHNHPLWDSWDLAVDMCLAQLTTLLAADRAWKATLPVQPLLLPDQTPPPLPPGPPLPYNHSAFFAEQLTAFEVWLEQGAVGRRKQPEQLPVVLQVLLSQAHRLKALILLCKFLDLGPWAVNVALSIGIFAYVLRLLQAPATELKPVLIYIWARILAVYESCKEDLLKQTYPPTRAVDQAPYTYFVSILAPTGSANPLPLPNVSEHRAMCAFILAVCCRDYPPGRAACLRVNVFEACMVHLHDEDPLLKQWAILCIAQMWDDCEEAKGLGIRHKLHETMVALLASPETTPEVRASIMYALGTLLGASGASSPTRKFGRSIACGSPASGLLPGEQTDVELGVAMATLKSATDGSPPVRRELVVLLSSIVNEHQGQFIVAAYRSVVDRANRATAAAAAGANGERPAGAKDDGLTSFAASLSASLADGDEGPSNPAFQTTLFACIYKTIFDLTADAFPDIAQMAQHVMDYIIGLLFASPLGPAARAALNFAPPAASTARIRTPPLPGTVHRESLVFDGAAAKPNGHPVPGRTATLMKSLANLTTAALSDPTPVPPSSLRLNGKASGSQSPNGSVSPGGLHSSASTDSLRHLQSRAGKPTKPKGGMDAAAIESAILALALGDEERLKQRRTRPSPSTEEPADQVLPLKGAFFDFALEYYKESQMRATETDEPGSVAHNQRVWRRARNESVIIKTQPMKGPASRSKWDEQIGFYPNETTPNQLIFHQFESHFAVTDTKGLITVYDWDKQKRLNRFANGSPPSVPISSARFVNEDDVALLMTGSADGHVRLFRNYHSPKEVQLASSFRGISETLQTTAKQDSGLVMEWQQGKGHLLMGGNVKYIRTWDATKEMTIQDLPTRANSCLTTVTCDQVAGNIIVGGFGDGSIRVYDRRLPSRENMVRIYKGYHRAWVLNVHMQRGGNRELTSGSVSGEVCLWDIRLTDPLQTIQAHQGGMAQMAVHEHAPVYATSSALNVVKVWNMNGQEEPISKFRNTPGFMGHKQAPMSSMSFHPHHMVLGCASGEQIDVFQMAHYNDWSRSWGRMNGMGM